MRLLTGKDGGLISHFDKHYGTEIGIKRSSLNQNFMITMKKKVKEENLNVNYHSHIFSNLVNESKKSRKS